MAQKPALLSMPLYFASDEIKKDVEFASFAVQVDFGNFFCVGSFARSEVWTLAITRMNREPHRDLKLFTEQGKVDQLSPGLPCLLLADSEFFSRRGKCQPTASPDLAYSVVVR